ncbi:MAG: hypothetical protein KKH94_07405 [Candidatus Omnitrophica bacterium]|nr:hypothetical protein [Candidatus Omnitrophota bacterium]
MGNTVAIEALKPGMIVDSDIKTGRGVVLLKQNSALTDRHIVIFKTWGIRSVPIREDVSAEELGGKDLKEVAQEKIQETQTIIDEKFSDVCDDEIMQHIKKLALEKRIAKIKHKYNV